MLFKFNQPLLKSIQFQSEQNYFLSKTKVSEYSEYHYFMNFKIAGKYSYIGTSNNWFAKNTLKYMLMR